jgi:hypothetical protein
MLDLYEEFRAVVTALEERRIDYAVCGGLAVAIYSAPRATVDIDLLILSEDLEKVRSAIAELGYVIAAHPRTFAKGAVEIRRWSKLDPSDGDLLSIDLLLVTPALAEVWASRTRAASGKASIGVVSREGLIALKSLRGSLQDLADIERLKEGRDDG